MSRVTVIKILVTAATLAAAISALACGLSDRIDWGMEGGNSHSGVQHLLDLAALASALAAIPFWIGLFFTQELIGPAGRQGLGLAFSASVGLACQFAPCLVITLCVRALWKSARTR